MPRKPRTFFKGAIAHTYFRGNRKEIIFQTDSDFKEYLKRLEQLSLEESCNVIAYSLMPNHGHLILEQATDNPISNMMHRLQGGFTQYWNTNYQKTGHVFQGRFKCSICLEESYLLELIRYVHLNAPRAGLVKMPEEYQWCSHKEYISTTDSNSFVHKKMVRAYFPNIKAIDSFVKSGLNNKSNVTLSIETAINSGLPHPLPSLSNLAAQAGIEINMKPSADDMIFFTKLARQRGYKLQDIANYLCLSRTSIFRMHNRTTKA